MQKIFLTSSGSFITTHNVDEFLSKKIADCKIAYLTTASKKVDDLTHLTKHQAAMDRLGWNYTPMDIAGKTEDELRNKLTGFDIVLVEGGNTFYLLKAIRESKFDRVIRELINQGVVYIGSSAGSYVACPSIEMATWSKQGFDRCGITDYTAMGLVSFMVKAHYTLDQRELVKEKAKSLAYPLYPLADSQALLIRDGEVRWLGEGERHTI